MPITVFNTLIIVSLVLSLINGINGRVPLWIPVFLIGVALLIGAR